MIREYVDGILSWVKRVISRPREELSRWQQTVRFAYDLGRFGARQLRQDRAPQMAAALAFRLLFGLVPVLVVATVLVRAVIGVDEFLAVIHDVLAWIGLDAVRVVSGGGAGAESQTLSNWLGDLIADAAGIRLTALGWVGLVVLGYASVSLLGTIENVFNIIYRADDGRPWTRRVPLYWFLLTVSPIAIGVGTWLNHQFELNLTATNTWPWAMFVARHIWNGLFGWLVMLTVYMLLPNTEVKFRPAAIGAFVAVVILEIGKRALGATLQNAFSISQLYGSLGLIPLFMFWTYLMGLAVLFGLQVSAILQLLGGRRLEEMERRQKKTGLVEPASIVAVMEVVARRFAVGKCSTVDQIVESTSILSSTVETILLRLVDEGLLHQMRGEEGFSLAQPADQIDASQLLDIGFALVDSEPTQSTFLQRMRQAQRAVASRETLVSVMGQSAG